MTSNTPRLAEAPRLFYNRRDFRAIHKIVIALRPSSFSCAQQLLWSCEVVARNRRRSDAAPGRPWTNSDHGGTVSGLFQKGSPRPDKPTALCSVLCLADFLNNRTIRADGR